MPPRHRASPSAPTRDPSRAARAGVLPWRGIWRQTWSDSAPLTLGVVVIAVAAFLSAVVPQATGVVATAEVRAAASAPDARTDIVVTVPLSGPYGESYELETGTADSSEWTKGIVDDGMPKALRGALTDSVTALVGPELKAGVIADRPGRARFIYVASKGGPAVEWVEGRAPASTGKAEDLFTAETPVLPVEVAVSETVATLMEVHPGDSIVAQTAQGTSLDVRVSGIFRPSDAADAAWHVAPTLLKPQLIDGSAAVAVVGLMVSDASVPFARFAVFPTGLTRTYTYSVVPSQLNGENAHLIDTEARGLASGKEAFTALGGDVRVTTKLDDVLDSAIARVDAGSAQASVLLIGVLAVALLVELLTSRLVMERRAVVLATWRSRGAVLPAIGLAFAVESVPMAAVGGFLGAAAARYAAHGQTPWEWLLPPLVVAAVSPPLLAMWAAARHGARSPSQAKRRAVLSAARLRRLGAEALLVAAAAGSLVTLRLRGVGSSADAVRSDVVVLAAPVLVALALTVMMVRAQPRLVSAARSVAARGRGTVPLLSAVRMRASGIATAALVTGGAVAAIAASVAVTVSHAQVDAAWDAVGADVAISTDAQGGLPRSIPQLDGNHGLTVATATLITGAQVIGPKIDDRVDIALVDADAMTRLVAATPVDDAPTLHSLASGAAKEGSVPVLVSGSTRHWEGATLRWGDDSVPVTWVGRAPSLPRQLSTDQTTVVVDRAALVAALGHDVPTDLAWVAGPGAGQRVEAVMAAASDGGRTTVVTREGWLAERRSAPVTRGLARLFVGAGAAAAALALLAVALVAASGSEARTRAIARIRVVGLPRSAAHRVAWLEVAIPATIASAAGLLMGFVLTPFLLVALDLESVTGGRGAPSSIIPWWAMALALALGLVARMSVALATVSRGRERLGALMRVG